MLKEEFIIVTTQCFEKFNFIRLNRLFAYKHKDFYIIFILFRSNYSNCYLLDYNCSIKALHNDNYFLEENWDIVLRPRVTLTNGATQIKPEEYERKEYEGSLMMTINNLLNKINKKGLNFIKKLEKKGFVLTKEAHNYFN